MAKGHISIKQNLINKTNARIVGTTAAASFIVIFCLVASVSLISQLTYQNRIIGAKKTAAKQLQENLDARGSLTAAYHNFVAQPTNIIQGSSNGLGVRDGDNGKIVLDALPSKYDFPALNTSIETILNTEGAKIQSITGTDEEVSQAANQSSPTPSPVPMPFEVSVSADYPTAQRIVQAFELSIRPIQIQTLNVSAGQDGLTLNIAAKTYYQPEKNLNLTTRIVK